MLYLIIFLVKPQNLPKAMCKPITVLLSSFAYRNDISFNISGFWVDAWLQMHRHYCDVIYQLMFDWCNPKYKDNWIFKKMNEGTNIQFSFVIVKNRFIKYSNKS